MRILNGVIAVCVGVLVLGSHTHAQQNQVRRLLFTEVEELVEQAQAEQAAVLAPASYARALERFQDADSAFERGKGLEGIQEDLEAARSYLALSLALTRQAREVFPGVIVARENATESEAPTHAQSLWERAERKLASAARKLEKGHRDAAVQSSAEASALFRMAEVEALKVSQLSVSWQLIRKAEQSGVDNVAPRTLRAARDLLDLVEIKLRKEAEVTEEVRALSLQAEDTARRALVIASRVRTLKRGSVKLEDILLASEDRMLRVANLVGADATFDTPPQAVAEAVIGRLEMQQARQYALTDSLDRLNAEVRRLKSGARSMEAALARTEELRGRVEAVGHLFADNEADVMQSGDRVLLRLHGISFGVGRAVIEPENFGLLSRVQDAIRSLPGAAVTIQGHTDSVGGDAVNLALSARRAEAVRRFLVANRVLNANRIEAVGFGESRPVASNDTVEGRAKNRRIDLVVSALAEGT